MMLNHCLNFHSNYFSPQPNTAYCVVGSHTRTGDWTLPAPLVHLLPRHLCSVAGASNTPPLGDVANLNKFDPGFIAPISCLLGQRVKAHSSSPNRSRTHNTLLILLFSKGGEKKCFFLNLAKVTNSFQTNPLSVSKVTLPAQ